jgi:hypothetical protein
VPPHAAAADFRGAFGGRRSGGHRLNGVHPFPLPAADRTLPPHVVATRSRLFEDVGAQLLELGARERVLEVASVEDSVDLEDALVDGQEGDVEGAAAQVEDQNVQMPAADVDDGGVVGGDQRASGRRKSWRCVGRQQGRAVSRESPSAYYRRPQRLQSTPRKWRVPRLVGE